VLAQKLEVAQHCRRFLQARNLFFALVFGAFGVFVFLVLLRDLHASQIGLLLLYSGGMAAERNAADPAQ
jgi:hypothetical protein